MVGPGDIVQAAGDALPARSGAVPLVARSVAGLRPWLVALCAGPQHPVEQFQFGARRIRLDLETDTEAHAVDSGDRGVVVALSRTQVRPVDR